MFVEVGYRLNIGALHAEPHAADACGHPAVRYRPIAAKASCSFHAGVDTAVKPHSV
jgi:hypothetical protein